MAGSTWGSKKGWGMAVLAGALGLTVLGDSLLAPEADAAAVMAPINSVQDPCQCFSARHPPHTDRSPRVEPAERATLPGFPLGLGAVPARDAAKDDAVEERVAAEAVVAVDTARDLARSVPRKWRGTRGGSAEVRAPKPTKR